MHHKTTETAHAKHSPRNALGPIRTRLPPTLLGNIYPLDDVVAVIDDKESAEQALRALRDAGLPDDDMDLLDGPMVVEADQSLRQRGGRLRKFEAWLSAVFSDEADYARTYVLEAQRGHYLVVAHAAEPEVVQRVSQVLRANGAHGMRHYELLTVTDL
jgi:hypothetical protein